MKTLDKLVEEYIHETCGCYKTCAFYDECCYADGDSFTTSINKDCDAHTIYSSLWSGMGLYMETEWRDCKECLPDPDEEVMCLLSKSGNVVSGHIYKNEDGKFRVKPSKGIFIKPNTDNECKKWTFMVSE